MKSTLKIESKIHDEYNKVMKFDVINNGVLIFSALYGDCSPFEWIEDNRKNIEDDGFPLKNIKGNSIFEKIRIFYDSVFSDDDTFLDAVYEYRTSHGLHFAFRGVRCEEVYIGKFNDKYQVSGEFFEIEIDVAHFIDSFKNALGTCD